MKNENGALLGKSKTPYFGLSGDSSGLDPYFGNTGLNA